jgi:hypothetical protein
MSKRKGKREERRERSDTRETSANLNRAQTRGTPKIKNQKSKVKREKG